MEAAPRGGKIMEQIQDPLLPSPQRNEWNQATSAKSVFGAENESYVQEKKTKALMNLAYATEADRKTAEELSATNTKITAELIKNNQLLTLALA